MDKEIEHSQMMALIIDSDWRERIIMSKDFKELEKFLHSLVKDEDFNEYLKGQNYFDSLDEEENQKLSDFVRWYADVYEMDISSTIIRLEDLGMFKNILEEWQYDF